MAAALRHLPCTLLLCLPLLARATPPDYQGRVDFHVHLQSVTSDWRYDNDIRRTRISRAGFGWLESLGDSLAGGLLLGYIDLAQGDNPLDTATYSDGYYGGLQLQGRLLENDHLQLRLDLSLLYNDTQNIVGEQRVNNVWTQTEARLQARIALGQRLGLRLDLNQYRIRGEQRDSGPQTGISNFRNHDGTGYAAGLDLVVDRSASIGFDWSGGNREGGRIYFRRRF